MRGYGESDKPPLAAMDKGKQARDFFELAQQLQLGRFALYGHDRGGRAARLDGLSVEYLIAFSGGKSRRKCIEVGGNSLSHPRDYIPNLNYV